MTCCGLSRRSPPSLVPSKGASMGEGHDLSVGGDVLQRVTRCVQAAIGGYGCHPAATVRLLNVSENATYLVDDPDSGQSILRVHRLGYHSEAEIESELAWMDALRAEAGVRTPRVLPAADGRRVVTVPEPGGAAARQCVRFEYLAGSEPAVTPGGSGPSPDDAVSPRTGPAEALHFEELGEITARMHTHSRQW